MAIGADTQATGIAERGHEQIDLTGAPPISTRRSPKSICSCSPGCVSKRTVARAAAINSRRRDATARSTVRRLTRMFFSRASSWRTTSAWPACRRKRSRSQSAKPSSCFEREGDAQGRQSPRAANAAPCSASSRVPRQSASIPTLTLSAAASPTPRPAPHHVPPLLVQQQRNRRML